MFDEKSKICSKFDGTFSRGLLENENGIPLLSLKATAETSPRVGGWVGVLVGKGTGISRINRKEVSDNQLYLYKFPISTNRAPKLL